MKTRDEKHSDNFNKVLEGKKIDSCRYMTREEADDFGWYKRPLAIFFKDGSYLILQSDDEGNDGGAGYLGGLKGDEKEMTIYTIS